MEPGHEPVLLAETLEKLAVRPNGVYVDATLGMGGHAEAILERLGTSGRLIGLDRDSESLRLAKERLKRFEGRFVPAHGRFGALEEVLKNLDVPGVDGLLFDLGISSYQLSSHERGFSFQAEGSLDMRMDRTAGASALEIVQSASEETLADIFWRFGEERGSRRIARAIVRERTRGDIATTTDLAKLISRNAGGPRGRIHPATRAFQALRIAVNKELEELESALEAVPRLLKSGGRAVFISFHSLEDRLVKHRFRERGWHAKRNPEGILKILTPKPVLPTEEEARRNPRSRSAKLRAAEKI